MSKINRVLLDGWVASDARVIDEEGKYKVAIVVNVLGNNRNTGNNDNILPKTSIVVASYNKKDGQQMESIKANDLVSIKGVLTTAQTEKGKICPMCGEPVVATGQICYVSPISVVKIGHEDDPQKATQLLKEQSTQEVSNEVFIIGNLCSSPKKIATLKDITVAQYQLAVPRNFRLLESINENTDYPWVKTFGAKADEQLEKLKTGSQVLVDGYISSRRFFGTKECPHCGAAFDYEDKTLEIIPYEVEYLRGYNEKGGPSNRLAE